MTHRAPTPYILKVPTPSGRMAPFTITADSVQDLHRQARIMLLHVWDRIEWPPGTAP